MKNEAFGSHGDPETNKPLNVILDPKSIDTDPNYDIYSSTLFAKSPVHGTFVKDGKNKNKFPKYSLNTRTV